MSLRWVKLGPIHGSTYGKWVAASEDDEIVGGVYTHDGQTWLAERSMPMQIKGYLSEQAAKTAVEGWLLPQTFADANATAWTQRVAP